jgi:hypothetical protein
LIDAPDPRLRAWLAEMPPRQKMVVRMALSASARTLGAAYRCADAACKIHSTTKMVKLLTEVRKQVKAIEARVATGYS